MQGALARLIRLAERHEPAAETPPLLYYCQRCGGGEFTLHVSYCMSCGTLIRNLFVISVAS